MTKPNDKRITKKRKSQKAPSAKPRGEVGQRFYEARTARGFTNRDALAREMGLLPLALYRLEAGLTENPQPATVRKICVKLDIDPAWLLHGAGDGPRRTKADNEALSKALAVAVEKYLASDIGRTTPPSTARLLRGLDWRSVGVTVPDPRAIGRMREVIESNELFEQHRPDEEEQK